MAPSIWILIRFLIPDKTLLWILLCCFHLCLVLIKVIINCDMHWNTIGRSFASVMLLRKYIFPLLFSVVAPGHFECFILSL